MKKLILMIVFTLICGVAFVNCSKETDLNENEIEGTYVGIYTTTNLTRDFSWNTTAIIVLKGGNYTFRGLSDGSLSDIYDVSGNYSINGNKITFESKRYDGTPVDLVVVPGFAVFLLDGEYNYKFEGERLIFSKSFEQIPGNEKYKCEFEFERSASR